MLDLLDLVEGLVADLRALGGFSTGEVPAQLRDSAYWADLALLLPGVLIAGGWSRGRRCCTGCCASRA